MYSSQEKAYYWGNRLLLSKRAKNHTVEMERLHDKEIMDSVKRTLVMEPFIEDVFISSSEAHSKVILTNEDTVAAIFRLRKEFPDSRVAVLNFASFRKPGGGFLDGSRAQEECLCHESDLFNILRSFPNYYQDNFTMLHSNLYVNRALYSPDVLFFRDDKCQKVDVITCAAPNKTAASKLGISEGQNLNSLRSRIQYIFRIARNQSVDILVLGAFGCGVFGQSAMKVAEIIKQCADNSFGCPKEVVCAVPKSEVNTNYEQFVSVFGGKGE